MDFYTNVCRTRDKILVKGYQGKKQVKMAVSYRPKHYIPSKKGQTPYRALDTRPLEVVELNSMGGARKFREQYSGVEGFEIHGYDKYIYTYIADKFQGDITYNPKLIKVASLDIECECEDGFPDPMIAGEKVNAISIKPFGKETVVFGIGPWDHDRSDVIYHNCTNEANLLMKFIKYWRTESFDIITGWNVNSFDITYLCNRLDRLFGDGYHKKLSPWRMSDVREFTQYGYQKNQVYNLYGVNVLDYLELYRKNTFIKQESYKLDYIGKVELGLQKDENPYDTFRDWYTKDYQSFIDYNIKDVEIVDALEDKLKLIELVLTMAYEAKVNYMDVLGSVKYWDILIYNYLRGKNIVIPQKRKSDKSDKFEGAYVKDPQVGMHKWVMSFDLNSLYPHLIMQYNISPETLVETKHPSANVDGLLNQDIDISSEYATCANGAQYRKDIKGFLPELMEKMYAERVVFKKRMLEAKQAYEKTPTKSLEKEIARCNNIQMAKKISLNSAYGAIGNQYFRYYKLANAEAITLSGQVSIRWIENKMNDYLNKLLNTEEIDYVIASDTDSIYINFGPLVDKFFNTKLDDKAKIVSLLDKVCQDKLEPFIDRSYQELATYVNAYDQKMFMKRENIADRGIWTAKKRYILNVWDSEGVRYEEPKLKMMGIEAVKSSTPAPCRAMIKDALNIMMSGTEEDVIKFIDESRDKFKKLPPEDISFPRTVSNVNKHKSSSSIYAKGTPIHARGALLYNHHIKDKKLDNKYSLINNGEKIKFCYLKKPNWIHENVISFISDFPTELDLDKHIDYELQFNKAFLEPVKVILDSIGWNVEKVVNLELFFS